MANWKGSIHYNACRVVRAECLEDIQKAVRDASYPSPVRAKGSHHSTTECIAAEMGTVIDVTALDAVEIDVARKTVTVDAGALLIRVSEQLEAHGLQFYVNIELGNLTVGSGACCATKESSIFSCDKNEFEFGQVSSYAIAFEIVQPDGSILVVDEQRQPELLPYLRSSYGLLGIVYKVTYRVKPRRTLQVKHESYGVREFAAQVASLPGQQRSSMLYLFPHLGKVVVERRTEEDSAEITNRSLWRVRNWVWRKLSPGVSHACRWLAEHKLPGYWVVDKYYSLLARVLAKFGHANGTAAGDQIIRYDEHGGFASYTFSIWAFSLERYPTVLVEYFDFCKAYYEKHGYRCDMLNVGYAERQDDQALFSYTRDGFSLTLDPVSTGGRGWDGFLRAFNEFCSKRGGKPLLNQTPHLTPDQVRKAFGERIDEFQAVRRRMDPGGRFYNGYFRRLFED